MKIPKDMMNEKPADEEKPLSKHPHKDILHPFYFLLSARRGIETDPYTPKASIPEIYTINYRGDSGVPAISRESLVVRLICETGRLHPIWLFIILIVEFTRHVTTVAEKIRLGRDAVTSEYKFQIAVFWAVIVTLILFLCRRYARRRAAAAIPPQFNPDSYQYRVQTAMEQCGMQYREIVSASVLELERDRRKEGSLRERFQIEGLVDPCDSRFVYDVVVRFYRDGRVILRFPSVSGKLKSGVVVDA